MLNLNKRYMMYLVRWQLSTPIMAVCIVMLVAKLGATWTTVIGNLIGGLIFFWVDRWIFRSDILYSGELWEIHETELCADCGTQGRSYRLIKAASYDRTKDTRPEFRCHGCSRAKFKRDFQKSEK